MNTACVDPLLNLNNHSKRNKYSFLSIEVADQYIIHCVAAGSEERKGRVKPSKADRSLEATNE